MTVFLPQVAATVGLLAALLAITLVVGFGITRLRCAGLARATAWLLAVLVSAAAVWVARPDPPGFRMLAIIVPLFLGMKVIVSVESQAAGRPRLPAARWFGFALLWPGMRPALFGREERAARSGGARLVGLGTACAVTGLVLILVARLVWVYAAPTISELPARVMATLPLLIGLSLVLHFGIFNMLAGAWRFVGIDCRPLFRDPLSSRSLAEFWGRRWNLAFSEMTALAVYRPLGAILGPGGAAFMAFLFSGLLHEMAISVPVRAGFGLPFLYFALHGGLVLCERSLLRKKRPVEGRGWISRVWTFGWLAVPAPILFHPPFLNGIIWPIVGMEER